jgi:hypothetical protein
VRCGLCGLDSARPMVLKSGVTIGNFCPGACEALGWGAHFESATGADVDARALMTWEWAKLRADRTGKAFLSTPPKSSAERTIERYMMEHDINATERAK